jgi:hypothetical protein
MPAGRSNDRQPAKDGGRVGRAGGGSTLARGGAARRTAVRHYDFSCGWSNAADRAPDSVCARASSEASVGLGCTTARIW